MPELLERVRHTIPQWELKSTERKNNIKGAFVVTHPEMVRNKDILLVDDIITTGITLDECAKVLKKAGAASVHALVVASGAR
jgi:predicted amidophosphoribosyltransferase